MKTTLVRFLRHPAIAAYIKFIKQITLVLVAFNIIFSLPACAAAEPPIAYGQILALQPQTSLSGVFSVLNGSQINGEVWMKDGWSIVSWPQSGGWAWACLKMNCDSWLGYFRFSANGQANLTTARTWSDMAAFLKSNGWTKLAPQAIPGAVTAGQTVSGFLAEMAGSLTSFMVIPIVPVQLEQFTGTQS